jgi:4,5-DOPA dioxygenase extradiol
VISAHWQTKGTWVTGNQNPDQIYDFYGFPDELYRVKYAPNGSKAIAEIIAQEVDEIKIDADRGIDHAGWAVVKHMYPDGDVPLLQLSLDILKNNHQHFSLGSRLGALANSGILFIGSGNMVHNLRAISYDDNAHPFDWAVKADTWLDERLRAKEIDQLINYEAHFSDYKKSIPTNEHYLPLLYILGMHNINNDIETIFEEIQKGSISMRSIQVC